MRKLILLIPIFLLPIFAFAQYEEKPTLSEEQQTRVTEVASTWFEEIFKAEDVDKVMQVSDIPFAVNREKVITSKADLKKFYLTVFEDQGQRSVPKFEKTILYYRLQTIYACIPLNFAQVEISIREGEYGGGLIICVAIKEDEYKVVGFRG